MHQDDRQTSDASLQNRLQVLFDAVQIRGLKDFYESSGNSLNEIYFSTPLGLVHNPDPFLEAERLVEKGETLPTGKLPINPSGGFLSFGEATTAMGVFQVCELTWQLRGETGARQVPDAKLGLGQTLGLGGNGTAVVLKK